MPWAEQWTGLSKATEEELGKELMRRSSNYACGAPGRFTSPPWEAPPHSKGIFTLVLETVKKNSPHVSVLIYAFTNVHAHAHYLNTPIHIHTWVPTGPRARQDTGRWCRAPLPEPRSLRVSAALSPSAERFHVLSFWSFWHRTAHSTALCTTSYPGTSSRQVS